jgi:hypothetical protein
MPQKAKVNVRQIRDKLIRDLQIVPENIKNEAIRQPLLFIEAVRYRVGKMRAHSRAKAELKTWSGQQWLLVKKKFEGTRITNDEVRSYLEKDPQYRALSANVDEAEAREEFAKLILEAYRMRRDGVRILADAEGYEASKATVEAASESVNRSLGLEARKLYKHRGIQRDLD